MPAKNCKSACTLVRAANFNHINVKSQIEDFFTHLFSTKDWPPRWHCGNWSNFHGWLYILSDFITGISYFTIPVLIIYLLRKRKDLPFTSVFALFVSFILLCGATHFTDAFIFWWPAYRFSALLRFCTAVVSVITVYYIVQALPQIFNLTTVANLEAEIKKRRLAEEKLRESEFLYSEAVRIIEAGTWEYDLQSATYKCSSKVYDIIKITSRTETDHFNLAAYFAHPYKTQLEQAFETAIHHNKRWDFEALIQLPNNERAWVRIIGEPVIDEAGEIVQLKGVLVNIDMYKNIELALSSTLAEMKQKKEQLRNFTHILSHNIRNHYSNIAILVHLLQSEPVNEENESLLDKLKQVCKGLEKTLNDLSDAIKIRDSNIAAEALSFKEETTKTLQVLQSEIDNTQARIELNFAVDTVIFPKVYLESILLNLFSNAIKYHNPERLPQICISTYKDEYNHTVLECRDNGLGIDLSKHGHKIFGLYKTFHGNKDAHGLGLFMTKTQVESQGARIVVDSTLNEGSTFKILFK